MSEQVYKIRLKKDDLVVVRTGKYKGQIGKILMTHPQLNMVTVEGINIVKRHIKPNKAQPQGAVLELTKPMHVNKVGILDPTTKKPVRIGFKISDDSKKTRFYKGSGKEIK
ncbi:MAG: 50S ribosomal protein L24 [Candidatus Saccharimonadales bacterium]